ncbi:MAG: glycerol-3-phosphate 1-O-acyltransferase PlsY [Alphaproteobacteria bacterium]|nr:glycerol-3-phosphate 1-O-acyltransferase PlsY [Alphaproteobacteria bacterium]
MLPTVIIFIVSTIVPYLLGSIPFGLLLTRMAGLGDIRNVGSGNIGATNVLRTGHKSIAALTLVLDGGKGALAVGLAALVNQYFFSASPILALNLVIIGHCFPIWLKFKGGKGVATFLGAWLAFDWPTGLILCLIWLIVALVFRYSSVASLVSALASFFIWFHYLAPEDHNFVSMTFDQQVGYSTWFVLPIVILFWRHRQNIIRLIKGTESTIKLSKTKS